MSFYRPTWAEIDLGALSHNIKAIEEKIGPETQILAMVKADAYGHGVIEVVRTLLTDHTSPKPSPAMLGVALIEEGIQLREAGFTDVPILLLGSIYPWENFREVVKYNLTPTICSFEAAQSLAKATQSAAKKSGIHIKIDTGMGRIGISPYSSLSLIEKIAAMETLVIEGIYTHFPAADNDPDFTERQISDFNKILKKLEEAGIKIPLKHIANSAAILKYKKSHFNMIRPGLSLYGLAPFATAFKQIELKPLMSLRTKVVYLKKVPIRASISYGRTFVTRRESMIATIPIGYADGYNRLLSNKGEVLIHGERAPVVGRVCMDMCMIDVTDISRVKVGDEVVLMGAQGEERISADDIAAK
ncbi:MAG: alanine racemase, partial [bacterium]